MKQSGGLLLVVLVVFVCVGNSTRVYTGSSSVCYSQSCCETECKNQGFCCDYDYHYSSNSLFSCLEACVMRVAGNTTAEVDGLCNQRMCTYHHPTLGTMNLCGDCKDSTNTGECVYGVTDSYACLAGSQIGANHNPNPPPPPPPPDNSTPKMSHPGSFYWGSGIGEGIQDTGFSWYTNVFPMFQLGYAPAMQVGLAGTWLEPYGLSYTSCPCDPNSWNCCGGKNPCLGFYETIEGGPGFWGDEMQTTEAKWRPGMSAGCYTSYASTPLFLFGSSGPVSCSRTWIVQVANNLVFAPDGLQTDGLLGVSYVKTPIGQTNSSDSEGYMTIILDSNNFGGPLAYILPDYWTNRDPNRQNKNAFVPDFTNSPQVEMADPAFEWNTVDVYKTTTTYKIPKLGYPVVDGVITFLTEAKGYAASDTMSPIEQVLESGKPNTNNIMAHGKYNPTHATDGTAQFGVGGNKFVEIGRMETKKESNGAGTWQMAPANKSCVGKTTMCIVPQYYDTSSLLAIPEHEAPSQIVNAQFPAKSKSGGYDAISHTASGGCQTKPGPASNTLYCVKTKNPSWVAYKWYKYIDQPAFQHLGLSSNERNYMQGRIENLHKAYPAGASTPHWIKQNNAKKYGIASIDHSLIVTPPKGMEYGYVPIAVYEGYNKPSGCA